MSAAARDYRRDRTVGHAEAAEILGIDVRTLYNWVGEKRIKVIKVGRLNRFKESDLNSYLEERTVMPLDRETDDKA